MRVIVNGYSGHMGQIVTDLIRKQASDTVVCGVCPDAEHILAEDCPVVSDLFACTVAADVVIDFSNHDAVGALVDFCVARSLPCVIATTGHTDAERRLIADAARHIPVFYSANMSVGIAMLVRLSREAASAFPDADIEIVEMHHNRKLDAPSGTAIMLADALHEVRRDGILRVGRHEDGRREPNEIGIHSIRAGNEVGTHDVIIATQNQVLTLRHEAKDRTLFAEGALCAASFLVCKRAGLYGMSDILSDR